MHRLAYILAALFLVRLSSSAHGTNSGPTGPLLYKSVRVDSNLTVSPESMQCSLNIDDNSQLCTWVLRAPNRLERVMALRLHFNRFRLPIGSFVRVGNENDTEFYDFRGDNQGAFTIDQDLGDTGDESFFAMSVDGSTAEVTLALPDGGSTWDGAIHRVTVDYYNARLDSEHAKLGESPGARQRRLANCGVADYRDIACFDKSDYVSRLTKPVARLLINNGWCTAFRVGAQNRVLSNWHCLKKGISNGEIHFLYEANSCGSGDERRDQLKVPTGTLLSLGTSTLDFALFTVKESHFPLLADNNIGWLGIDPSVPKPMQPIAIVQHPDGGPKKIAAISDAPNAAGKCAILKTAGSHVQYKCDTEGGSSGSPVISIVSNKSIAIHAWGLDDGWGIECTNAGVSLASVWPSIGYHFTRGQPPNGYDSKTDNTGGNGGDVVGIWSPWSSCSVSCGGGTRSRRCLKPSAYRGPELRLRCRGEGVAPGLCSAQRCVSDPAARCSDTGDYEGQCRWWKDNSQCTDRHAQQNCRKTCGLCGDPTDASYEDLGEKMCSDSDGNTVYEQYQIRSLDACKKSCSERADCTGCSQNGSFCRIYTSPNLQLSAWISWNGSHCWVKRGTKFARSANHGDESLSVVYIVLIIGAVPFVTIGCAAFLCKWNRRASAPASSPLESGKVPKGKKILNLLAQKRKGRESPRLRE